MFHDNSCEKSILTGGGILEETQNRDGAAKKGGTIVVLNRAGRPVTQLRNSQEIRRAPLNRLSVLILHTHRCRNPAKSFYIQDIFVDLGAEGDSCGAHDLDKVLKWIGLWFRCCFLKLLVAARNTHPDSRIFLGFLQFNVFEGRNLD
jgi:hypothetical protein